MSKTPFDYWQQMSESAALACNAMSPEAQTKRYLLANIPVEFTFIGNELCSQFAGSISHLAVEEFESEEPPVRIVIWDENVTFVPRPFGDLREAFNETAPFSDGILAGIDGNEIVGFQSPRACTLLHTGLNRIVGWVRSAKGLSRYEIGKPLQPVLFYLYNMRGIQPVHAGLVAERDDGILIGGPGGAGKSTTSLLCVQAGFSYLADDYVGLPMAEPERQVAYSLYSSLWLEEKHSGRFEKLRSNQLGGQGRDAEKMPFGIAQVFPSNMARKCSVRVVLLPRVVDQPNSFFRPATPVQALLRLAPSSVLQLPFIEPQQAMCRLATLLRRVPSYWLHLGRDLDEIPNKVAEVLWDAKKGIAESVPWSEL